MLKKEYKHILIIIFTIIFPTSLFFICKLSPFTIHLIGSKIDIQTPFIPYFIYFYISWYLLLFFIPFLYYKKDKNTFYKYVVSNFICAIISALIFLFYPTTIIRPEVEVSDITSFIINFIYTADTPALSCFPSMHCMICFLFMYNIPSNLKGLYKIFIYFICIMIILSTLFVKQHVLIDVISAFVVSLSVNIIVKYTNIHLKIFKS